MSNPDEKPPAAPTPTTAADRLAKEPLDRLLGRLSVEQRAALAYGFANRALRVSAPRLLESVGQAAPASRLKALAAVVDDATAGMARDVARQLAEAADKARDKEEESGKTSGPAKTASQGLSFAVATVKAALGETGLRVTQTSGPAGAAGGVKKEAVDTGVQRALLAGKYAVSLLALQDAQAAQDEEALQRQELMTILKAPRRI